MDDKILFKGKRLQSLDVLRGFDMFWIIGGGSFISALAKDTKWVWIQPIAEQMHHVKWEGFHFEDLIFPLFMFISGVAIPYAINAKAEKGVSKSLLALKIVKRALILFLLGLVYNGILQNKFTDIRFAGVLAQIGFAYLFAALIFLYTKSTQVRILWLSGILAIIAVLQLFVPVPGYGAGVLDPFGGMNAWLDRMFLPGILFYETFDPEGLLCTVSAVTVTLMGGLAGTILRDGKPADVQKTMKLAVIGTVLLVAALALSPVYPIVKNAWTVPFNLLTAGISFLLLAIFYYLIDVSTYTNSISTRVVFFFKVIGMNSITIYMANELINFKYTSSKLVGWLGAYAGSWVLVVGVLALEWLLLWFLYRKQIFLKV
jgi:predicted acyltransferase